jgi:hypothetical protein
MTKPDIMALGVQEHERGWRKAMRILIVAVATVLLTVPAYSQAGGFNATQGAGRMPYPEEPKVDAEKKKADEKAFNDAIKRIPSAEKKYDPWGTVRQNGK